MKIRIIFSLFSLIVLLSCENNNTKKSYKPTNSTKDKDYKYDASKVVKEAKEDVKVLKTLTPFTEEKFKKWLPSSIDGMTLISDRFMKLRGSQGSAKYANAEGTKTLNILINDGAGIEGSQHYLSRATISGVAGKTKSENDDQIQGIFIRDGVPSTETYWKKENKTYLQTIMQSRYIISVNAKGMNPDELYHLIKELNIENLK